MWLAVLCSIALPPAANYMGCNFPSLVSLCTFQHVPAQKQLGFGYQKGLGCPTFGLLWANKSHRILTVLPGFNSLSVGSQSSLQSCFNDVAYSVCASVYNVLTFSGSFVQGLLTLSFPVLGRSHGSWLPTS